MKKTIIIEVLLLFNLAFYLDLDIRYFISLANGHTINYLAYLCFIATITIVIAIILIALKDFKPLADKLAARKVARQEAKAEKAQADKQAKISELEKQLEELKKD